MTISLKKGANISLTKEAAGLSEVTVGLGWKPRATDGAEFDLDASVFMLGVDEKVLGDGSFVFYGSKVSPCGSVVHQGDNRDGEGEGDDEQINVNLSGLPSDVKKLAFSVSIYEHAERNQNFGQVSNAYIRILNKADGVELARFDLSEDASTETAMIFAEVYNHNGEWKFKAIGQGYEGGLGNLAQSFGVSIG